MRFGLETLLSRLLERGLNESAALKVTALFRPRRYVRRERFAVLDEPCRKLGFVLDGVFAMSVLEEDGNVFVKKLSVPGDFLLAGFDPEQPAAVDIQALSSASALEADYAEMRRLCDAEPDVAALARSRFEFELETIYARLASFAVLDGRGRYRRFREEYGPFEALIPLRIVASYLGVTPTQLSRLRGEEKRDSLDICR